jgi:hypothetical protein
MNKSSGRKKRTKPDSRSPAAGEAAERESKDSGPLLLTLLNKTSVLAFLFCLLTVFLYAAGLRQGFTGSNLLTLVQSAVYGGIILALLSIYCFAAGIWFSLRLRRPRFLLLSLGFLVLGALGALTAMAGTFITALAGGNA